MLSAANSTNGSAEAMVVQAAATQHTTTIITRRITLVRASITLGKIETDAGTYRRHVNYVPTGSDTVFP
ncbi:MAG: hypothetical protein BGO89_00220 [Candidatus Kapaibacterium thiocyanatum]|uniref:Uncharacterized protein n=1 Tax=Candidatus Kapaibacterium thiocyanatum TaxID=1895771 RepID=A0A1M3L158_9BACT|nr:MAG: hypothetical protein BGO89_00220 ['Candidatus Kapabacteria' thiocyanatum]